MHLSRDVNNNCRFFFALRLDKFLEEHSPFGNLYKNPETKANALGACDILSMRVHRIRLKGSPEMGSKPSYTSMPGDGSNRPKRFNEQYQNQGSYMFMSNLQKDTAGQSIPMPPYSTYTTEDDEILFEYKPGSPIIEFDGMGSSMTEINSDTLHVQTPADQIRGTKYFFWCG